MDNDRSEQQDDLVIEDLIEEVSIDGMCGVY